MLLTLGTAVLALPLVSILQLSLEPTQTDDVSTQVQLVHKQNGQNGIIPQQSKRSLGVLGSLTVSLISLPLLMLLLTPGLDSSACNWRRNR